MSLVTLTVDKLKQIENDLRDGYEGATHHDKKNIKHLIIHSLE